MQSPKQETQLTKQSWQILIVDDEPAVHQMLMIVLDDFVYMKDTLQLHHAYSAEEAKEKLEAIENLAVILLDVVMETESAGLDLVNYLRGCLKNDTTQVVILTGQPGLISPMEVISGYEVNSYYLKSETLSSNLFIAVTAALRSFHQLRKREVDAWQDQVTGLANRRMFELTLERAVNKFARDGVLGVLVLIDLDNFKRVNDLYGHQVGDHLLKAVATRLLKSTRGDELAARVGGDELALIATSIHNKEKISCLVERLQSYIKKPLLLDGLRIFQTTSIGVSFIEDSTLSKEDVYRRADEAMYQAKNSGKDTYRIFDANDRQQT